MLRVADCERLRLRGELPTSARSVRTLIESSFWRPPKTKCPIGQSEVLGPSTAVEFSSGTRAGIRTVLAGRSVVSG